mgnify:CR=1 FL=1
MLINTQDINFLRVSSDCSFSTTVSEEIFATSFKPFASNQGAVAQSNPLPNVLSGETIY